MMVLLICRMKVDECSYILKMDVENSREIRITQTVLDIIDIMKHLNRFMYLVHNACGIYPYTNGILDSLGMVSLEHMVSRISLKSY